MNSVLYVTAILLTVTTITFGSILNEMLEILLEENSNTKN